MALKAGRVAGNGGLGPASEYPEGQQTKYPGGTLGT